MNQFPYKEWTLVTIVASGEDAIVEADEVGEIVAVRDRRGVVYLARSDIRPRTINRTAMSYDRTSVG